MGSALEVLGEPADTVDSELLRIAFDANPEGLALVEQERIRYANPAFAELFGYDSPSEVAGRTLASFRPEDKPCTGMLGRDPARVRNGTPLCEFAGRGQHGKSVQVETSCRTFPSRGHDFMVVNIRDITGRERRRSVRDSERHFRAIFNDALMGIVQCDTSGRVLKANPALGGDEHSRRERAGGLLPETIHRSCAAREQSTRSLGDRPKVPKKSVHRKRE